MPSILKYGTYMHVTSERLGKGQVWFRRYGPKALVIGYFVPGLRHLTVYLSGMSQMTYGSFLYRAAIGAITWVLTFISLGLVVDNNWELLGGMIHRSLWILLGITVIFVLVFYWGKRHRKQ